MQLARALTLASLLLLGCDQIAAMAPKADPGMSGRVTGIRPSNDQNLYANVTIAFENRGKTDMSVKRYTLRWTGGKMKGTSTARVARGGQSTITVKVYPKDGDVTTLLEGKGSPRIEIVETGG